MSNMVNFSNCYIAKVKSFLGLKSMDSPVPFDEFLEQNFNDLASLIKNNKILVLDNHGNEIDSSEWKEYIIDFYNNNDHEDEDTGGYGDDEKINLDVDDMFVETDDQEINLQVDDMFSVSKGDQENESETEIQEELELINKIDTEEKAKIAHKQSLLQFLEDYDEPSREILEKGLKHANQKIEELQNEREKVLNRINQKINIEHDTFKVSDDGKEYDFEEDIQEELQPINKINTDEKVETDHKKRFINSLDEYDESHGGTLAKELEKHQYIFQKNEQRQSEQKPVPSGINQKSNDVEEIQEEDGLERIKKIDAEEKAKIVHKNRLIKSLEQCDGLERDILERGLKKINQKIKDLQNERESVLIRINQKINQ